VCAFERKRWVEGEGGSGREIKFEIADEAEIW